MTDRLSETLPFGTKILLNGKYRTYLYIADAAAAIVLIGLEIMVLRGYQKRKASAASEKRSES